ncbi:MAG: hypothetical protein IJS15_08115 [Victivallales bacterium]|nr:hypothetical protein [Victivallales bacterium]
MTLTKEENKRIDEECAKRKAELELFFADIRKKNAYVINWLKQNGFEEKVDLDFETLQWEKGDFDNCLIAIPPELNYGEGWRVNVSIEGHVEYDYDGFGKTAKAAIEDSKRRFIQAHKDWLQKLYGTVSANNKRRVK